MTTSSGFIDLRINNAEQLKESISEPTPNTVVYLTYGKIDAWANDSAPTLANSSVASYYEIWNNMIGGKRLFGGDMHHVIPRYNWVSGNTYVAYDHMSTTLHDDGVQFYVMNSDYSVYKCLANANSAISTVEPTSVNPSIASATSDGYIWKYMYTISDSEQIRYTTNDYIPVKTLSVNDGSLQWQVQSSAIDGAIESIFLTNPGTNYTNTSNIIVTIAGDGSGATASARVNTSSNTIESIIVTNSGTDYTYGNVTISGGAGSGATARLIISPPGGHGSNPLYELGGNNILINTQLKYDEDGSILSVNDFRQVSLLMDPYIKNTSNVARFTAFNQTYEVTMAGGGDYLQDEMVYQGRNLAASTFSGRVVSWDATNQKLYLINTNGTPVASQALIGTESITSRVISSVELGALKKYSGRVLYVDNISPITRSDDQIEDFKIILRF